MDQRTKSALEAVRVEILSDWEPGQEIVGVDIVDDPRPGLVLQLQGWLIPSGRVLDVFIPAHAQGKSDETGLLDELDEEDGTLTAVEMILFHFVEGLGTGDVQSRSLEGSNGHLYANLYG
jgi:hypothetical protein